MHAREAGVAAVGRGAASSGGGGCDSSRLPRRALLAVDLAGVPPLPFLPHAVLVDLPALQACIECLHHRACLRRVRSSVSNKIYMPYSQLVLRTFDRQWAAQGSQALATQW